MKTPLLLLSILILLGSSACERRPTPTATPTPSAIGLDTENKKGVFEKAGEKMDEGVRKTGEGLEKAGEKLQGE